MRRIMIIAAAALLILTGCESKNEAPSAAAPTAEKVSSQASSAEQNEPVATVRPLPDNTMENLSDAILSVSLEKGGVYVDDTGKLQMDVKIFTYDKYDMVDISNLKVGDVVVTHAGEVKVTSLERNQSGIIYINGGLENGGFDLVTDNGGIFFETGYNDAKNWYQVGKATIRVSVDFIGRDNSDPDSGEKVFYPGSFLNDEVADYNFTPYNTTVRVADGQIVEMNRMYTP